MGRVSLYAFMMPITKATLKLVFGELADHVISSSSFVLPKKLSTSSYLFVNTDLEDTLRPIRTSIYHTEIKYMNHCISSAKLILPI
jgi:NAD dependent epimerase/dehydratase family enzyme